MEIISSCKTCFIIGNVYMNNEKNCFNTMIFLMNLMENVLIKRKNNCMILPWTSLFQFFKVILFVWNKLNLTSIMSFSLCVHMSANYSFTENIVVTKIELCYFVCFVMPVLLRRKKGVDDIFSLLFFFLLCQISMRSVDIWLTCLSMGI